MIAGPLVLVKIALGNWKDGNKGSSRHSGLLLLSNDAKQRERDRLGRRTGWGKDVARSAVFIHRFYHRVPREPRRT
jgi:hypothetical protein